MTEITQADRDRAAPYAQLLVVSEPVETLATSFARHRQQAVAAEVAQIVAWLRDDNVYCWTDQEIADAIERGDYKETNK